VRHPNISGQEGRVLILALVVLAIGSLLVPILLSHLAVKLHAVQAAEEVMKEQYASDAGIEYAIGQLLYNPDFYSSLMANGMATITIPQTINNIWPISVTITSRGSKPSQGSSGVGYVIWSQSSDCTGGGIDIRANDVALVGNVHTNSDIKIKADTAEITGTMEYVTTYNVPANMRFTPSEDNPRQVSVMPQPPLGFSIEDYRPEGKIANSVENYYHIEWCPSSDCMDEFGVVDGRIPDGLYYVESGDVKLSHPTLTGTVTIVAEGGIEISGQNAHLVPYSADHLLLFSNKQTGTPPRCKRNVIKCKGKNAMWEGLIYGLGGRVWVQGAGQYPLSLIGNTVYFKGDRAEFRPFVSQFSSYDSDPCEVFDIVSMADSSTITSRVVVCNSEVHIASWRIQ